MAHALTRAARAAAERIHVPLRRETVLWAPGGSRVGNHFYFWLRADHRQARGERYVVRRLVDMDAALSLWPALTELTAATASPLNWLPPREDVPDHYFQRFGEDFAAADLDAFITDRLLSSPAFEASLRAAAPTVENALVINVRRGNFYAFPAHRGLYSYDIHAYLGVALEAVRAADPDIPAIDVVSDDIGWCRTRLGWLADHAPRLTFTESPGGALHDFARIAAARRLIIPNSTFSYWAAHVSAVLHPGHEADIVAPAFHNREVDSGRAWQLDPRWTIIQEIPGGWDS